MRGTPIALWNNLNGLARRPESKNAFWLLGEKVIKLALLLFVTALVARYLGPKGYGPFAYILAMTLFFQAVANLGVDAIAIRDLAQKRTDPSSIGGTVFIFRFVFGVACYVGLQVTMLSGRQPVGSDWMIAPLLALPVITQAFDSIDLWFQANSQSRRTVFARIPAYCIGAGLKLYAIHYGLSARFIALGYGVEAIAIGAFLGLQYSLFKVPGQLNFVWSYGKKLLRESLPVAMASFLAMIYMRLDQILLNRLAGPAELGKYGAIVPFLEATFTLPVILCLSWAPVLARNHMVSRESFFTKYSDLNRFLVMVAWLVILATMLGSRIFVTKLLGPQYHDCILLMRVFSFSLLFTFLGIAQSPWLVNERKTRLNVPKTILGVAVSIPVNILLIPRYGALGCAIATVLAQFTSSVATNLVFAPALFRIQLAALFGMRCKYIEG